MFHRNTEALKGTTDTGCVSLNEGSRYFQSYFSDVLLPSFPVTPLKMPNQIHSQLDFEQRQNRQLLNKSHTARKYCFSAVVHQKPRNLFL